MKNTLVGGVRAVARFDGEKGICDELLYRSTVFFFFRVPFLTSIDHVHRRFVLDFPAFVVRPFFKPLEIWFVEVHAFFMFFLLTAGPLPIVFRARRGRLAGAGRGRRADEMAPDKVNGLTDRPRRHGGFPSETLMRLVGQGGGGARQGQQQDHDGYRARVTERSPPTNGLLTPPTPTSKLLMAPSSPAVVVRDLLAAEHATHRREAMSMRSDPCSIDGTVPLRAKCQPGHLRLTSDISEARCR